MDDDLILRSEWLTFRALETTDGDFQAKQFLEELRDRDWRKFLGAARTVETALRNRRRTGRLERVEGSKVGLLELKITAPGSPGPQLRILRIQKGRTIWLARGLVKRERLRRRDIELAEAAVRRFLGGGGS